MLEHTQHAELALLIDQSVVGDDGKIEMQGSDDPDGSNDVVLFDLINHVHPLGHLAEDGMHSIEMGLGGVGDEELAATGVLPGMGHRQGAHRLRSGPRGHGRGERHQAERRHHLDPGGVTCTSISPSSRITP